VLPSELFVVFGLFTDDGQFYSLCVDTFLQYVGDGGCRANAQHNLLFNLNIHLDAVRGVLVLGVPW
jgi:hypothetical protein